MDGYELIACIIKTIGWVVAAPFILVLGIVALVMVTGIIISIFD